MIEDYLQELLDQEEAGSVLVAAVAAVAFVDADGEEMVTVYETECPLSTRLGLSAWLQQYLNREAAAIIDDD